MSEALTSRRRLMTLAWPAIIENLSATLVIFIDSAMVGSLGAMATAAIAVNASPTWLMGGLIGSIGIAGTALSARMWGAGEKDIIRGVAWHTLGASLGVSILLMAFMIFGAPLIPRWMGAEQTIHQNAAAYMRIIGLAAVPHYLGMSAAALLRGTGDTKSPMRASLLSHLINISGNFLLIFPSRTVTLWGLSFVMPGAGMGVTGAAIATAVSYAFTGIYLLRRLFGTGGIDLRWHTRSQFSGATLLRLMRIALPAAMERISINLGQIVFAGMVVSIGTAALAAHHLAITIESLGYMPGYGFAVAAATLVGQGLGAHQPRRARMDGLRAILTGVAGMSVVGVLMFVFADSLIALFTPDETVRLLGAGLIRICAFEQPFSALSIIAPGALRGAGDTSAPFYIALVSMWGVRIVLAYVLGTVLHMGIQGIWLAMLADHMVRGSLLMHRYLKGNWQQRQV